MREYRFDIDASISSVVIHAPSNLQDGFQSCRREMLFLVELSHNRGKLFKIVAFCGAKWISLKERDNLFHEVFARSHHKHPGFVVWFVAVVRLQIATTQRIAYQLQHMFIAFVLGDVQFWNDLPTQFRTGITLDGYMEAAFAVHKPSDVVAQTLIWPSLLIACT